LNFFSLGVTAEALRANIDGISAFLLERGQFNPEFQLQVVALTNILLVRKLEWMVFHVV